MKALGNCGAGDSTKENHASFLKGKLNDPSWWVCWKFARWAFFIKHFIGYDICMRRRGGCCIGNGKPNITKWPWAVWNSKDLGDSLAVVTRLAQLENNLTERGGYRVSTERTGHMNQITDQYIWHFKEAREDPGDVIDLSRTSSVQNLCSVHAQTWKSYSKSHPGTGSTYNIKQEEREGSSVPSYVT